MKRKDVDPKPQKADAADELWRREVHALVRRLFRTRLMLIPMLFLVLGAFLLFDPTVSKLALLVFGILVATLFFLIEELRLRKKLADARTIHVNLLFPVLIQSLLVHITGGIASPMLAVYIPLVALGALALVEFWRLATVAGLAALAILSFAVGEWSGMWPSKIPVFFMSESSLIQGQAWLWTRAIVMLLVLALTVLGGISVRRAFERMVRAAIGLRHDALDTLESRNREILSTGVTIAHELKNPLASIQGLTQLMARKFEDGSKDRERIDVMLREIQRMGTILDEFRNFTRPLSGLTRSPVPLPRLVSSVVALHEGIAAHHIVSFRQHLDESIIVDGDPQKLKQALVNLVKNALEASPTHATIRIYLQIRSPGEVELSIHDEGPGIDTKLLDKLFEPGFTTKEQGTGIGLVVARSVIEQHGGKLLLENPPTGGCVATILLPSHMTETAEVAS